MTLYFIITWRDVEHQQGCPIRLHCLYAQKGESKEIHEQMKQQEDDERKQRVNCLTTTSRSELSELRSPSERSGQLEEAVTSEHTITTLDPSQEWTLREKDVLKSTSLIV